jgi:hypothetical protein
MNKELFQNECTSDAYITKRTDKAHAMSVISHNRCRHQVKCIG